MKKILIAAGIMFLSGCSHAISEPVIDYSKIVDVSADCIGDCTVAASDVIKLGMLEIRTTGGCFFDGRCDESNKRRLLVLNEELNEDDTYGETQILLDAPNIPDEDDELMVVVYGAQSTALDSDMIETVRDLIKVKGYKVLSKVPYHAFLRDEKSVYTKKEYGCKIGWNTSFAWDYRDGVPIIKVKMQRRLTDEESQPYIELWYDGNTGDFIKELNDLRFRNPCKL